jgi:pheromone a factor receptor
MYCIWTKGREVKSILGSSSSPGSAGYNHYIRLFMLSGIDILITIPFNIWYLTTYFHAPFLPWPGWTAIHTNWSHPLLFPLAKLGSQNLYQVEAARWVCVVYGLVFFGLFGVATEAKKHYASAWQHVSNIFCCKTELESSRYVLEFILFLRSNWLTTQQIFASPSRTRKLRKGQSSCFRYI